MSWLSDAWDWGGDVAGIVGRFVDHAFDLLKEWARKALEFWVGVIDATIHDIYGSVGWLYGQAFSFTAKLLALGISTAVDIAQSAASTLSQAVSFAADQIKGVYGFISDQIKNAWHYVDQTADHIYHAFVEPLWKGIENAASALWRDVVSPAIGIVTGLATGFYHELRKDLDDVLRLWRWITDVAVPVVTWTAQMIPKIASWMADPIGHVERLFSPLTNMGGRRFADLVSYSLNHNAQTIEDAVARWLG